MKQSWLPLMEYSTKYKVSVSTLRRRIKTEDIQFCFDDGKYLILDEPVGAHPKAHRPSLNSEKSSDSTHQQSAQKTEKDSAEEIRINKSSQADEPILTAANRLLTELKKAYTQILHEKEEQILQLREEISDLKTLVRVLEGENDRLKK